MLKPVLFAAALLAAAPVTAKEPPLPAGLRLDRVVLMMRHGVRPPTKSPPMPAGTASAPWPSWPVEPGYLTPHGRAAVGQVGTYDRASWIAAGLLPRTGCARLRIVADSDQRTIETARAYVVALAPAESGKRPKLTGALDRASTAAQILLLEYADGKPMAEVGWGRVTAAEIGRFAEFHATEFRLLARPRYVAKANLSLLTPLMIGALTGEGGAPVTMIAGHDTNVASLGGLLGVHWHVPGLAADDPAPGGAIVLERLVDARGQRFVRALYRSQTLDQIRALAPATAYVAVLPIAGCSARGVVGLCTEADFVKALTR